MNIEKIKNYNQRMLAVVSTLAAVLLIVFIISFIVETWPRGTYDNSPQGLLADEQVSALADENLRKQVLSYETPWLIDSLKSIYIIPVSIRTLNKPEETTPPDVYYDLLDMHPSHSRGKISKDRIEFYRTNYVNLIVYDAPRDKTTSLFNQRVIVGDIQPYYFKDEILLIFYAATKDTNQNGIIDLTDLRSLYIYSFETGELRTFSDGENQAIDYQFIEQTKNLLVKYKLSQYKKEQFGYEQVPNKIMKYNFETQELTPIIPTDIEQKMQGLVEGKEQ